MEFERTLRQERKRRHISQQHLAQAIGLEIRAIAQLESGIFVHMNQEQLNTLASALGVDAWMFRAMYQAEFRPELKSIAKQESLTVIPALQEEQSAEETPSDLLALAKALMQLPAEAKATLLRALQVA